MPMFISVSSISVHIGLLEISTLSRQQHRVAQTREVACTKIVLPQVIARGLLLCPNILQFHIFFLTKPMTQATIKLYVRQLGMVNSYDPWHGKVSIGFQW